MNEDDLRRIDAFLDLPEDDPRREEALRDGRFRNLLREYESFLAAEPEVASSRGRAPRPARAPRRRAVGIATALVAGLALVAVIATEWIAPGTPDDVVRLRNGASESAVLPSLDLARSADELVVDWTGDVDADSARVVILGADLREVDRRSVVASPPLRVDLSGLDSDAPLGVRIVLVTGGRVVLRTPVRPVPAR